MSVGHKTYDKGAITMYIRIYAENQRRVIKSEISKEELPSNMNIKQLRFYCLGLFYAVQTTYTKLIRIELVEGENVTLLYKR